MSACRVMAPSAVAAAEYTGASAPRPAGGGGRIIGVPRAVEEVHVEGHGDSVARMPDERLRIATWNLWWRFGPWELRQPAIEATMRRIGADVWCLQEVYATRDGEDQAERLA